MISLRKLTGEELTETWKTTGMSDTEIEMEFSDPDEDGIIWIHKAPNCVIPEDGAECVQGDEMLSCSEENAQETDSP